MQFSNETVGSLRGWFPTHIVENLDISIPRVLNLAYAGWKIAQQVLGRGGGLLCVIECYVEHGQHLILKTSYIMN